MFKKRFRFIKNIFTIKKFLFTIIIVWIIFSIGYVGYDQWWKFRAWQFQAGYQAAITDSVKAIMDQSDKCLPTTVTNGDKKVEIIATSCLQQPQEKSLDNPGG